MMYRRWWPGYYVSPRVLFTKPPSQLGFPWSDGTFFSDGTGWSDATVLRSLLFLPLPSSVKVMLSNWQPNAFWR